jgi:glutamyl/glutaminyl-tRNA synthetase
VTPGSGPTDKTLTRIPSHLPPLSRSTAPEPSGYLHIGHIKACILNRFFADKYKGKFILRFDDTNPEKEEDEFEGSFEGDLKMLGVGWDKVVHTSDHFAEIEECARKLVRQGDAFMDDTDQQTVSLPPGFRTMTRPKPTR